MVDVGHWLFLGLLLPHFGFDLAALRTDGFRQMSPAAGQDEDDKVFFKRMESKELGQAQVSAMAHRGRLSVLAANTPHQARELEQLVTQDTRCGRLPSGQFQCRIDDGRTVMIVDVCGDTLVVYSESDVSTSKGAKTFCEAGWLHSGIKKNDSP